MKIKITESQLKRLIEKQTIEEAWYNDVLDAIKNSAPVQKVKDIFKDVTGIDFDEKETVNTPPSKSDVSKKIETIKKDIPSEKEIEKKIKDVKTDVTVDNEKDTEEKKDGKTKKVIFVSGLHNRSNDESVNKQTKRVSDSLKINADVEGYSHTDSEKALRALESEPNSYVLLFSAGCAYSEKFARKLKSLNKNLNNLYVIEPHSSAKQSVTSAVKLGLPESNVWVGSYAAAGLGIVSNPTSTKKTGCDKPHWCAINQVARQL